MSRTRCEFREIPGCLLADLTGSPESTECDQVGREIVDRLRSSRAGVLLLSLKPLETVSSSVLGLLTGLQERLLADGRQLWLCDLAPEVKNLLRVTRVDLLMRLFADEETALQALTKEEWTVREPAVDSVPGQFFPDSLERIPPQPAAAEPVAEARPARTTPLSPSELKLLMDDGLPQRNPGEAAPSDTAILGNLLHAEKPYSDVFTLMTRKSFNPAGFVPPAGGPPPPPEMLTGDDIEQLLEHNPAPPPGPRPAARHRESGSFAGRLFGETFSGFFRKAEQHTEETLRPGPAPIPPPVPTADIRLTADDLDSLEDSDPELDLPPDLEPQPRDEDSLLRRLAKTASGFLRKPDPAEPRVDALPPLVAEQPRSLEGESFLGTLFPESFPELAPQQPPDQTSPTAPGSEPVHPPVFAPAAEPLVQRAWSRPLPEVASTVQSRKSLRGWLMTVLIDLRVLATLLAATGVVWYFLYSSGQIGPEYYPLVAESLLEEYRRHTPSEPGSPQWQSFVESAHPRVERAVLALSRQGTNRTPADGEMLTAFKKMLDLTSQPQGNPELVNQIETQIARARELNAPPEPGPDGQSQLE